MSKVRLPGGRSREMFVRPVVLSGNVKVRDLVAIEGRGSGFWEVILSAGCETCEEKSS